MPISLTGFSASRKYEVIVSNIGPVYWGDNADEAFSYYDAYKGYSESNIGRAAGEQVIMLRDGEPYQLYIPTP